MRKLFLSVALVASLFAVGCTDNSNVKNFGGTAELALPKNEKLVNLTWKESNLWILTKPMSKTDSAETYRFTEKSDMGMMEGTYIIKETK